jgi:hypothetical protein
MSFAVELKSFGGTRLFPTANGTLQQDSENHGLDEQ